MTCNPPPPPDLPARIADPSIPLNSLCPFRDGGMENSSKERSAIPLVTGPTHGTQLPTKGWKFPLARPPKSGTFPF